MVLCNRIISCLAIIFIFALPFIVCGCTEEKKEPLAPGSPAVISNVSGEGKKPEPEKTPVVEEETVIEEEETKVSKKPTPAPEREIYKEPSREYAALKTRVMHDMKVLEDACMIFKLHTGTYPLGLVDFLRQPKGVRNWKGPYLKDKIIPRDPWGTPYVYIKISKAGEYEYVLVSYGADRRKGGRGAYKDITNHDDDFEEW